MKDMFTIPPIMKADKTVPSMLTIAKEVAREFGLNYKILFGRCRIRAVADARKVYFYMAHLYTSYSATEIAESMNRKHNIVGYSVDSINFLKDHDKRIATAIQNISNKLDNE